MPSINIRFGGIIALLYERDQANNPITCVLGVVEGVPDHKLTIECTKKDNGVDTVIPIDTQVANLRLEIEGTTENGIRRVKEQLVDRITGDGDQDSFSWILDFEDELYDREIGVDPRRFRNIFRINNCEVFTDTLSENLLLCNDEANPHESPTLIGKVATVVGLRADLNTEKSVARLFDGANQIAEITPGQELNMKMFFDCDHVIAENGLRPGHANHYYRALGTKLLFGERKLFSSTKMPQVQNVGTGPATPDASCLVGGGGRSNPGGD